MTNIIELVPKDKKKTTPYIEIIYSDNTVEKYVAGYFAPFESIPNFLAIWEEAENSEENQEMTYINTSLVKSFKTYVEEEVDNGVQ